jgi:hypothetical protein
VIPDCGQSFEVQEDRPEILISPGRDSRRGIWRRQDWSASVGACDGFGGFHEVCGG